MNKLKTAVGKASSIAFSVGLLAAIALPFVVQTVSADSLNPLTKRTLLLSSSSPGWDYLDGSGNGTYAPAGSGANGKNTSETFTFDTSSDATHVVKAFSLQYCTKAAGDCIAPGNDGFTQTAGATTPTDYTDDTFTRNADTDSTSDFNVNDAGGLTEGTDFEVYTQSTNTSGTGTITIAASSAAVVGTGTAFTTELSAGNSITVDGHTYTVSSITDDTHLTLTANAAAETDKAFTFSGWTPSSDWGLSTSNQEEGSSAAAFANTNSTDTVPAAGSATTGKNNYITLVNTGTGLAIPSDTPVKLVVGATSKLYLTNPGAGAFYVKINDYSTTTNDNAVTHPENVIDGGVTVANVMNNSIEIETKVLETMEFSVGVDDPDAYTKAQLGLGGGDTYGSCANLLAKSPVGAGAGFPNNTLLLGDSTAEYSLDPLTAYDSHSYWRLTSNSANGGTVYYSGATLHNTEGNAIAGLKDDNSAGNTPGTDDSVSANPGTEQFGLAIMDSGSSAYPVSADFTSEKAADTTGYYHNPGLDSGEAGDPGMAPTASYGNGDGNIDGTGTAAKFAFNENANTTPVPIAVENGHTVDCATGRMRYIGDISGTTPAGIYTTKINYLAAPEY